jgi:outer membrane protein OmpA-like peptidoglycan-associated protein
MSINLNQLVQGALSEGVLQQLAGRIGCAPESARRVVSLCAPALIGSMMDKASSLDGARNLFAAIMAPSTNAQIADELPHFVTQDDGFKSLIDIGERADGALASHDRLNLLSERISDYTGVAASATRTLSGVVGATVLGVLKRYLTQHNSHVSQLPTLLGHQLPIVRANMTDSFAHALGLGSVGAFLAGVASRLKAVSAHLEHPATHQAAAFPLQLDVPSSVDHHQAANDAGHRRTWLWVASAAALALFAALAARGCSTDKEAHGAADGHTDSGATVAASGTAEAAMPAVSSKPDTAIAGKNALMNVTVDASGVPTLKATVRTEAERQRLIDVLAAKLGADKFQADISVDPDTRPADWLSKIDLLLPVMSQPDAQIRVDGEDIVLSASAAESKFDWIARLKSLFGEGWTIGTDGAQPAAAKSGEQCEPAALVRQLNLKPVNFRFGSNTPSQAALDELAKSVKTLNSCDAVTPIKLHIVGYSDNTGSKAVNLALSKKRAEAVRAFMIKHGVPAAALITKGFGDANPIASNKTAAGRQANRRIEFALAN